MKRECGDLFERATVDADVRADVQAMLPLRLIDSITARSSKAGAGGARIRRTLEEHVPHAADELQRWPPRKAHHVEVVRRIHLSTRYRCESD